MNCDFDLRKYLAEGWLFKEADQDLLLEKMDGVGSLSWGNLVDNPKRAETFLKKVEGGEEFVLNSGEKAYINRVVQKTKELKQKLRNLSPENKPEAKDVPILVVKDRKDIDRELQDIEGDSEWKTINAFAKTGDDFGGGGGQGGGTLQTKYYESGQCVINALVEQGKFKGFDKPLKDSKLKCNLGKGLTASNVLEWINKNADEGWKKTLIETAKHLVARYPDGYWHWKDSFVTSIEKVYSDYTDRIPGAVDRWNPADIWFTKENLNNISDIVPKDKCLNLTEFTKAMNILYTNREVAGISLKRLQGDEAQSVERDPELEIYKNLKLSEIRVRDIKEGTATLNIEFKFDGVLNLLAIRQGNEFKLRAATKIAKGGEHFDGGCTEPILEICLKHVGVQNKDILQTSPAFYKTKIKGIDKKKAAYKALVHLQDLLIGMSEENLNSFVTLMVKYCWSVVPQSARHYKVF